MRLKNKQYRGQSNLSWPHDKWPFITEKLQGTWNCQVSDGAWTHLTWRWHILDLISWQSGEQVIPSTQFSVRSSSGNESLSSEQSISSTQRLTRRCLPRLHAGCCSSSSPNPHKWPKPNWTEKEINHFMEVSQYSLFPQRFFDLNE